MEINEITKTINDFRELLKSANEQYNICDAEIVEADKAMGDIRHFCELFDMSGKEYEICQYIHDYSIKRRRAKDKQAILKPLVELIAKYPQIKADIGKIANIALKEEQTITGERHYNPRVIMELFREEQ